MNWTGEERREYKRFGVKRLGIRYCRSGLFSFITGWSDRYLVLNIAEGGLFFMTREELRRGQRLAVMLSLPGVDQIRGKGRVIWSLRSRDHDAWKIGVRFVGLSDRNSRRLKNLIDTAVLDRIDVSTSIYLREVERL